MGLLLPQEMQENVPEDPRKVRSSILKRGWMIVKEEWHEFLPPEVARAFHSDIYRKPSTVRDKLDTWGRIEKQVFLYAKQSSDRYEVEFEDLLQEAYILYEKVLEKYQPLYYRKMRETDLSEDPVKFSRIYTYDENGQGWAWKLYRLEPYLCTNLNKQVLNHAQKLYRKDIKTYSSKRWVGDDGESFETAFESLVYHWSDAMTTTDKGFSGIERKLLQEKVAELLTGLARNYNQLRREIADYYYNQDLSEEVIAELVEKPKSTVNSHLAAIRRDIRSHSGVQKILSEFEELGITRQDIF